MFYLSKAISVSDPVLGIEIIGSNKVSSCPQSAASLVALILCQILLTTH